MQAISINKNVQGGLPCFAGTRVPVAALFDYLKVGETVDEFLADFPTVAAEQVQAVLDLAKADMPRHAEAAGAR